MHLSAVRVCSSSVHVKITVLHSMYMYWLTKKNLLRYTHVGFQISAWAPGTLLPFLEVWGRHYWWDYSWNTQRTWKNNASVLWRIIISQNIIIRAFDSWKEVLFWQLCFMLLIYWDVECLLWYYLKQTSSGVVKK